MSRPRKKGSKIPYSGLGLKPEEDAKLLKLLEKEGYTGRQLMRGLLRQWMEYIDNGGSGLIKYRIK
jgi:hypothetical protein